MPNNQHIPQNPRDPSAIKEATRRRMMALFAKSRMPDDLRHDLIHAWTGGRTSSSKDLELQEMRDLCFKLETNFDSQTALLYLEAERKKLRAIVLKIATDTGIKEPTDFVKFNRFMKEYSILKKDLHRYTLDELHDLVKQFRAIERNYKKSASHPGTKAWFNAAGLPAPVNN
jgi:hypothetical protein